MALMMRLLSVHSFSQVIRFRFRLAPWLRINSRSASTVRPRRRTPCWRDGLWACVDGRGLDVRRLRLLNDSGGGDVLAELSGRDAALNRCGDYGLRVAEDESGGADNGEEEEGDDAHDGGR